MAESKSADPKQKKTTGTSGAAAKTGAKAEPKAGAKAKAATKAEPKPQVPKASPPASKKTSQSPVRLVKRTEAAASPTASTKGNAATDQPETPSTHLLLDPEYLGRTLHDRPGWIDEVVAILLAVFGIVSLLSLFNTSSAGTLSSAWSTTIHQFFGYVGAVILSVMIISAGILIVLPRVGVVVKMPWQRVLTIEIAYFAFLAILHLLAHDPEPRALARNGQGGGYIGWALSDLVFKVGGSGLAIIFFGAIMLVSIGMTFGIRRAHIRRGLLSTSKRLEALAERMKREPPPRPARIAAPMARAVNVGPQAVPKESPPAMAATETPAAPPRRKTSPASTPMTRPLLQPEAPSEPTPEIPTLLAQTTVAPAAETTDQGEPKATPSTSEQPVRQSPSRPTKPVIQAPEKRARYFTVEDFKELRQPLKLNGDLPPITLLSDTELNKPTEEEVNTNVRIIEHTLLEFDIDVEVVDVKVGPTVTQYGVQPFREVTTDQGEVVMQRVRVNKIASLSNDLALALSAKRLRIQPYVPGHPYMGIEVPNKMPSTVALRPVMESEAFAKAFIKRDPDTSQMYEVPLAVPLGRDVSGSAFVVDLAAMPHLLIAGTTGSGKSVCMTAIAVALVMTNLPDRLKVVMLDPKLVELSRFNGLPHLLGPVEADMERIIGVLRWATREMDRRYKLLEAEAARNIEAYNKALGKLREAERLPYIVILVDEIGDLMLSRPDEMERTLARLAQMARAVGIHLVVATQRPSVDVITGLIKANFPARISFAVASGVDSRVILDTTGAETLMGRGDMLYLAPDASGPQRLQGCFVSDQEIEAVVNYWKDWKTRQQEPALQSPAMPPWETATTRRESLADMDPLLEDAIDLVVREGEASASLIQRRLGIGYPRAAQLVDMLVELGVAGSLKEGGRAREVLMKPGTDSYKKLMDKRKK